MVNSSILLLTYDKNIDSLFVCCNPFTSFTLSEGADVCSIVFLVNWIDVQTPIMGVYRKLAESSLVQWYFILPLPLNLWGWSSFSTTAYSPRSTNCNTLQRFQIDKSCYRGNQLHWFNCKLILYRVLTELFVLNILKDSKR